MFTLRAPKSVLAFITGAMVVLPLAPATSEASPASSTAKRAGAAVSRAIRTRLARLDREAHRRAVTKVLNSPRTVFRYVSASRARQALTRGFTRMTHFTTRVMRGRPLSALNAQKRYGLPQIPAKRLTVTLPKGTPVKTMKAHGGARGAGELINTRPIPRSAVTVRATTVK